MKLHLKETMNRTGFQNPTEEDAVRIWIDSVSSKAADQEKPG